ncbi:MAG: beta-lactamase family protein [bacterium]|nr:beta-lactamase family protein [bacterium]
MPTRRLRRALLAAIPLLVACIAGLPARAVAGPPAGTTAALQRVLDAFLAETPGPPPPPRRDVPADPALTPAHTFRIASNTKTYVAATVLRLAEEGRLSLEAPLADLLPPDLATVLAADGYALEAMTVRQVLSHTAGLADHSGDDRYGEAIIADPAHAWTREEQVQRCAAMFDPLGPAPAPYRYSDTGYVLLGGIVERVTGKPLAAAVREQLGFARLGLGATWWEDAEPEPAGAGPAPTRPPRRADDRRWHGALPAGADGARPGRIPGLRPPGLLEHVRLPPAVARRHGGRQHPQPRRRQRAHPCGAACRLPGCRDAGCNRSGGRLKSPAVPVQPRGDRPGSRDARALVPATAGRCSPRTPRRTAAAAPPTRAR